MAEQIRRKLKRVEPDKWYIADMDNMLGEPRLLWNEFDNRNDAEIALFRNLARGAISRWIVLSGARALKHGVIPFGKKIVHLSVYTDMPIYIKVNKHRYPAGCLSMKQRKRWRSRLQKNKKLYENRNLQSSLSGV